MFTARNVLNLCLAALLVVLAALLLQPMLGCDTAQTTDPAQPAGVSTTAVPGVQLVAVSPGDHWRHTHVPDVDLYVQRKAYMGDQGWGYTCIIRINGNQLESWLPEQQLVQWVSVPQGTWLRVERHETVAK